MNKRVYGVIGISSIMANWNADFTGHPKSISTGEVFGSDKALKYPMKKMWENEGRKVLYLKSMKLTDGKNGEVTMNPRNLRERYEQIFHVEDLKSCNNAREILRNLMSAIDVKNFGATFAEEGNNISITGAVQIGQGFNKYAGSTAEEQQILSPFRDSKDVEKSKKKKDADEDGDEAKSSTLGTKIVSNEAHYFYPFVINPLAYKELVEMGVTDGYTEDDYQIFKRTALVAATSFATNAKEGCENEFAIFLETKPDTYLPNLSEYITFGKGEKNIISLQCAELLNSITDQLINIEIYYNPYTTILKGEVKEAKLHNILTQKEV